MKRTDVTGLIPHPAEFFIDGEWRTPSSKDVFDVVDSATEETFVQVAAGSPEDMSQAVGGARRAFDSGPWPRMTHAERAEYLRLIAKELEERADDFAQIWPRESGVVHAMAKFIGPDAGQKFMFYASLADEYPFEERATPSVPGKIGVIRREPVGVVGAIIPWNGPLGLLTNKVAPSLLAGCTAVVKSSPEAPGASQVLAEIMERVGLPPGVLNFITADREVSELLVRDPRIDKIAFTGSTAVGRRIASLCGERIARFSLELGGKSAAVILDDVDLEKASSTLAAAECRLTGQVCASLTRIIVSRSRHDALVEALASQFENVQVGDPFEETTQMGPLAMRRQRDRVESYIATGIDEGAVLAAGGGRPEELDRGWFVEPTVFGGVDNSWRIAREEIFGPVLCVIPVENEDEAISVANDTIYGLNASVFTDDPERAYAVASQLRSGTVGHNAYRLDMGMGFGGFKQSGVGREGGRQGLESYLESKSVILDALPTQSLGHTEAPSR